MKSLLLAIFCSIACAQTLPPFADSITAASLRGIVSFLASDALQGRDTPSPGLDAAAAYIASEFRADGLESPTGTDYAQSADFNEVSGSAESLLFSISGAGEPPRTVPPGRITAQSLEGAHLVNEPVFKWAPNVKVEGSLKGKILILRAPSDPATIANLELSHPDGIVELSRDPPAAGWRKELQPAGTHGSGVAIIELPASDVESIFDRLPNGYTNGKATLNIGAPTKRVVRLQNMIGILRGSDPRLRDQYILVTAHYDHLGASDAGIFTGANDNASGTAAVLALANALAKQVPHPKRTLLFVTFFGEEKGLLGSTWFARHPPVPLPRIVADINFEQLGDVDVNNDVPPSALGVTGYGLSDLPKLVAPALASAGVELKDTSGNLNYFGRSDNFPFAQAGIPSHTFVAAYDFPDYHRVTDNWQKLNYENMARITRALAVAIDTLADSPEVPHWIESPQTKSYLEAWRTLHH